jgi:hypothetical protein
MMKKPKTPGGDGLVTIKAPNILRTTIEVEGTSPYVQNKFPKTSVDALMVDMATPKAQRRTKAQRPTRDYDAEFARCQHVALEGWRGIPCPAFRAAMIAACRTIGLAMTTAKMSVFVLPDGIDREDGTPLVRILSDAPPERLASPVRNANGAIDIRIRAMWRHWHAAVAVEFDADLITAESIVNLLDRAGRQVGIGEGRPFSKDSNGQGWGTFAVQQTADRAIRESSIEEAIAV